MKARAGRRHGAEIAGDAVLHAEQERGGVVGRPVDRAAEALAVDRVEARRRDRSWRRSRARPSAPAPPSGASSFWARHAVFGMNSAFGTRHGAFMMHELPRSPAWMRCLQLDHLRMEAAVVADADRHAGLAHGRRRGLGLGLDVGERLLAIDMLAGGRRRDDLRAWPEGGVASTTASMPLSETRSSNVGIKRMPRCFTNASVSGVTFGSAAATTFITSDPSSNSTSVLPHQPSPAIATLIMSNVLFPSIAIAAIGRRRGATALNQTYQKMRPATASDEPALERDDSLHPAPVM